MALYLIATPIGNPDDISLRAIKLLESCSIVIGEELKQTKSFLSSHKLGRKELYKLNEHSTDEEIEEIASLCAENPVCLVSDCGTPGFCDPGSRLVKILRKKGIPISSLPGASSLMIALSLSSQRIDNFYFRGFLPANSGERKSSWKKLRELREPQFLLETPYRLKKILQEFSEQIPGRKILVALNLTSETEMIWEGKASEIMSQKWPDKAEPIFLIYP